MVFFKFSEFQIKISNRLPNVLTIFPLQFLKIIFYSNYSSSQLPANICLNIQTKYSYQFRCLVNLIHSRKLRFLYFALVTFWKAHCNTACLSLLSSVTTVQICVSSFHNSNSVDPVEIGNLAPELQCLLRV